MRRVEKIPFFVILVCTLVFLSVPYASAREKILEKSNDIVIEGVVTRLIDRALGPQTPPAEKDELLKKALRFASAYSVVKGDDAFQLKIRRIILTSPAMTVAEEEKIKKEIQERMLYGGGLGRDPARGKVRQGIQELVEAVIEEAFEPRTLPAEKTALLETAERLAKAYSKKTGDKIFYRNTQRLIQTLPSPDISGDEEIIKEFQKAMLKDNRLVMSLLVKRIGPRIEPFVTKIIATVRRPGTPPAEKELLFKTAMNLAKTQARISGDNAFHRKVHRRVVTALLSAPVRPEVVDGVNIVYAPRPSGTVKNVFRPDNIVIGAGETVRWVNEDDKTHVIGTLDFPSDGYFFAPGIGPGAIFEHTFLRPGEYYYICFIHNTMMGKVTVKE
ncbi:MAG: hypothetical protein BMS9Abin23_1019 [Thermodesulfobacteriota bacterium]|nr:MAG: hypothetical protein BMS9Abin23_1019 [Thermodesulfobacteriota bacterium]